MRLIKNTT
ncbi:Protein of unknown function [Streptococcus thermophilus]|nr:Protein of unknown function [Streptococcus thermophilus]